MSIFYAFWPCVRRYLQMKVAEGVRFDLTRPFGLPVFKTGAINRSATPPGKIRSRELCHDVGVEQTSRVVAADVLIGRSAARDGGSYNPKACSTTKHVHTNISTWRRR